MTGSTTPAVAAVPRQPSVAVRIGLIAAVAVPALYYGAQLAAAPFYPGYNFLSDSASLLGSDFALVPQILNCGAFLTGIAVFAGAYGIHAGLRQLGARLILTWLTTLSILSVGLASIWAALYHMPNPRHAIGAAGDGMLLVPLLLLVTSLRIKRGLGLKIYLAVNLLAFIAVAAFVSGFIEYDARSFSGLTQRCLSLTIFVPIAVVGGFVLRRLKTGA